MVNTKYKITLLFAGLIMSCVSIFANNPLVKNAGMSDPHIRVFNDTIYLYSGHDTSPKDSTWIMKNWLVYSTTDLIHWTLRDSISPKDNYMANNSVDCWASDAASRHGQYYFYFSDRKRGIGVMKSHSPTGPFKDALGKALVSPMHDPTLFVDDNKLKTPYLIYGDKTGGGFHIAALNDDMISLAEQPKRIIINGKEWNEAPDWMDKNYLFKHNDTYYLSWGRDYAISKHIYGPYTCVGSVGNGHHLDEFAHGSFFEWKGQFYHIWCYYIKPGYKYRESIISYCHFDDQGRIVTDTNFLDQHYENGVGQYNAAWDKIEAEWYYEISGEIQKQGNKEKGFVLKNIKNGAWISFENVTFGKEYNEVIAHLALEGTKGVLEIRTNSPQGPIIGHIDVAASASFSNTKTNITRLEGTANIYLVFKASDESSLDLDYFRFN